MSFKDSRRRGHRRAATTGTADGIPWEKTVASCTRKIAFTDREAAERARRNMQDHGADISTLQVYRCPNAAAATRYGHYHLGNASGRHAAKARARNQRREHRDKYATAPQPTTVDANGNRVWVFGTNRAA